MYPGKNTLTSSQFDRGASRTRLHAAAVAIGRDYLVHGRGIRETAKRHGVTPERVRRIVARIFKQAKEDIPG